MDGSDLVGPESSQPILTTVVAASQHAPAELLANRDPSRGDLESRDHDEAAVDLSEGEARRFELCVIDSLSHLACELASQLRPIPAYASH